MSGTSGTGLGKRFHLLRSSGSSQQSWRSPSERAEGCGMGLGCQTRVCVGMRGLTMGSSVPHCPSVTVVSLQIPKDAGFSLDTSIFSAFIPQVSSLAVPAQSSSTHRLCSVPGVLPQEGGFVPLFPSSPYAHTAGGDVPEHANEVQAVHSHCSVPDYWTRRNLAQAHCGCPGLCHPSQLQSGSTLPPQPGEFRHSPWQWGKEGSLSCAQSCCPDPARGGAGCCPGAVGVLREQFLS